MAETMMGSNPTSGSTDHWKNKRDKHWAIWPVIFFLPVLILLGPHLLGRTLGNIGMTALTRALVVSGNSKSQTLEQTENLFRQALIFDSRDVSSWRGLGFALAVQGRENEAVVAWQNAGEMVEEFIQRGEQTKKVGQYQEALTWYERAVKVEPGLGNPWYEMGLVYEDMKQWNRALHAYERAADASVLTGIGRSSPYYRQGLIYQWRLEPRQTEAALDAYEAAIAIDDFSNDLEAANCHYQRGEILRWAGRDPDECIAEYQRAIDLNPDHASAHVYLGVAYYIRDRDVTGAEAELRQALLLQPENQWAWYHLGEIYRQEGRVEEAIRMYTQALEIAPDFEIALERLKLLTE
jgi:tetratricopeptide (TPR) repeat protein